MAADWKGKAPMELYARSDMNNSVARSIEVYATPLGSFIKKELPR